MGTSGCRAVAIDDEETQVGESACVFAESIIEGNSVTQDPRDWWYSVEKALHLLCQQIDPLEVAAIAVDGTSGTILLSDASGIPLTPALMYNDARAAAQARQLTSISQPPTGAQGATSALAKLMWLHQHHQDGNAAWLQHQSDWVTTQLCGRAGITDYNNALKLGYDAARLAWPEWINNAPVRHDLLPAVGAPGDVIGTITNAIASTFGFNPNTSVTLGTTDSVAAFIAAGADETGDAVTSLGSTLVLKLLSDQAVFSEPHGVYSHRLGDRWLVGGASNSGGAVLLNHFTIEQIETMTPLIDTARPTGLKYYPLATTGERFPVNDPQLKSRIEPVPDDALIFFQALLEGIATIEARGYRLLADLGAPYPTRVLSSGGGAKNQGWTQIRQQLLGVPVTQAKSTDAAYGAALLARTGHKKKPLPK